MHGIGKELCVDEDVHAPTPLQPVTKVLLKLATREGWDEATGDSTRTFFFFLQYPLRSDEIIFVEPSP